MVIIGIDDTDVLGSPGTGHLAREIAGELAAAYEVLGVTRHQLLVDDRVPCTKNNSCAALVLDGVTAPQVERILERVRILLAANHQPGSDPGLCIARQEAVAAEITDFGRRAQRELVTQEAARELAGSHGIPLLGLGGTEDGIIGALAAVGLAATGDDGRYVQVGRLRELQGLHTVATLLEAGVAAVQTRDGRPVSDGLVLTDRLRPARRSGRPVTVVEWAGEYWLPLKLD